MNTKTWLCGPPPASGQYQQYPSRFEFNLKKYYPQVIKSNTLHRHGELPKPKHILREAVRICKKMG